MRSQESSSSVLLCGKDSKWKIKLEELLQPNHVVMLLSLGDVKYDVLSYSQCASKHPDTRDVHQILEEKGKELGLKVKLKGK